MGLLTTVKCRDTIIFLSELFIEFESSKVAAGSLWAGMTALIGFCAG
jgi:hypothetical protein